MPTYNNTFEDYSPQIVYSSDWRAGSSSDSLADLYSDSSFTLTQTDGGSANFMFMGTAVTIFGSKRNNHGLLQVIIDGNVFPAVSGKADDPGQFQVPLFASPLLNQGLHSVELTNQGSTFVDIDFITVQNSIGQPNEPLIVNTIQDTDSSFSYNPPTMWGTGVPNVGTYSGSSGHGTATPGSFVVFNFAGDSVYLYGPVGPAASPFGVSLNGAAPTKYSANKQFYRPQTLLYSATNLGPGKHQINVTYEPSQPGQILAVDYAEVYTTASLGGTSNLSSSNSGDKNSSTLSGGAIAGIIIALLFVLFVLAALIFFLRRRRQRKERSTPFPATMSQNQGTAAGPMMYNAGPAPQRYASSADGSYYANRGNNIGVDTQRLGGSATSESEFSPTSHYGGGAVAGPPIVQQTNIPAKGQPPPLPNAAGQSLSQIPTHELRANRRVVSGRQQDFGTLPPNYVQATEPYAGGMV